MRADFHFIVPIRHPETVKDPGHQQKCLEELFGSLQRVVDDASDVRIVCDVSQKLPPLPRNTSRIDVTLRSSDFPEPRVVGYEDNVTISGLLDKGRRVVAGLNGLAPDSRFMVVDDDDLIHREFLRPIRAGDPMQSWIVDKGFTWSGGRDHVIPVDGLHKICGTSVVLPVHSLGHRRGTAGSGRFLLETSNHRQTIEMLRGASVPLSEVPFRAVIYRRGHKNSLMTGWHIDRAEKGLGPGRLNPKTWLSKEAKAPLHRARRKIETLIRGGKGRYLLHWDRPVPLEGCIREAFFGG